MEANGLHADFIFWLGSMPVTVAFVSSRAAC